MGGIAKPISGSQAGLSAVGKGGGGRVEGVFTVEHGGRSVLRYVLTSLKEQVPNREKMCCTAAGHHCMY